VTQCILKQLFSQCDTDDRPSHSDEHGSGGGEGGFVVGGRSSLDDGDLGELGIGLGVLPGVVSSDIVFLVDDHGLNDVD